MVYNFVFFSQSFHDVGLYWVGSFGYSKLVLVLAAVIGKIDQSWSKCFYVRDF